MHHKSNRYDIGNKTEWEERKVKVHFQLYSSTLYINVIILPSAVLH